MSTFLSCAMMALSAVSGNSCIKNRIILTKDNIGCFQESMRASWDNVSETIDVFSIDGLNKYSLIYYSDDNFALCDKIENKIVESGVVSDSIYRNISNDDVLVFYQSKHFVYDLSLNRFRSLENNNLFLDSGGSYPTETCYSWMFPNATFIENVSYFDNLNGNYGVNSDGTCGIIASEIMFGYLDTFYNDNIVPEEFEHKGSICGNSPSTDIYNGSSGESTNAFKNFLIEKSTQYNGHSPVGGMNLIDLRIFLNHYFQERNVSVNIDYDSTTYHYLSKIVQCIDNNMPVIVTLPDHYVVVYGYDEDYFYLDYGWNDPPRRVLQSRFLYSTEPKMIISIEIVEHVHSNNFFNASDSGLYCGCGYHHSNRLIMEPSDWGFAEQYFFNWKTVTHNKDGLQFTSKRLRTGYIQSSVINLSPRRVGAGAAIFDIFLGHEIYEFNVELAWWSSNELETQGYADLIEHKINDDELTWHDYADDFLENTIPHGHQNKINRQYFLRQNTDGIRFDIQNERVGNQNRGRLSIGVMMFDYYI